MAKWCARCRLDANDDCEILAATCVLTKDDPRYPRQWTYERNEPVCTAFEAISDDDHPHMESAAVADLFPGAHRIPSQGEQVRMMVRSPDGKLLS